MIIVLMSDTWSWPIGSFIQPQDPIGLGQFTLALLLWKHHKIAGETRDFNMDGFLQMMV